MAYVSVVCVELKERYRDSACLGPVDLPLVNT